MNTFGQNIASFRKNKNLTQEKLAELIGISPQSVSKWENDVSMPDIALLPILADIFSTSIDSLFGIGESGKPNREQIPEKAIESLMKAISSQFDSSKIDFEEYRSTIAESNGISTALFTDTNGAVWANEDIGVIFRKSPDEFQKALPEMVKYCLPILNIFGNPLTLIVLSILLANTTPSSASYIANKAEITAAEAEEILFTLSEVSLVMSQDINFDDSSVKLWRICSTHKMLFVYTILIMSKKLLDGDNYYCYLGSKLWCR